MSCVAIIPARGGSKRIPRKNLKPFDGVPMIVRSIRTALESGLFESVVVSTDDDEIADVARAHGAEVPFMRPADLADDFTGTAAVIVHALQQLPTFDYACCVYATAPLLQARYLRQGLDLLKQHPRQGQAAGNVAAADGWRGVGADQHSHCSSPPALSAAYRYSARCQSSGVSMSWTK